MVFLAGRRHSGTWSEILGCDAQEEMAVLSQGAYPLVFRINSITRERDERPLSQITIVKNGVILFDSSRADLMLAVAIQMQEDKENDFYKDVVACNSGSLRLTPYEERRLFTEDEIDTIKEMAYATHFSQ